jgi:hypothetical protein
MNTKLVKLREEEKNWREIMKKMYSTLIHTQRVNNLK